MGEVEFFCFASVHPPLHSTTTTPLTLTFHMLQHGGQILGQLVVRRHHDAEPVLLALLERFGRVHAALVQDAVVGEGCGGGLLLAPTLSSTHAAPLHGSA